MSKMWLLFGLLSVWHGRGAGVQRSVRLPSPGGVGGGCVEMNSSEIRCGGPELALLGSAQGRPIPGCRTSMAALWRRGIGIALHHRQRARSHARRCSLRRRRPLVARSDPPASGGRGPRVGALMAGDASVPPPPLRSAGTAANANVTWNHSKLPRSGSSPSPDGSGLRLHRGACKGWFSSGCVGRFPAWSERRRR